MIHIDDIDQDEMAAAWGAEMGDEEIEDGDDDVAAQWAAMVDDTGTSSEQDSESGDQRILKQGEIDKLLGFGLGDFHEQENDGIRAIANSALVAYERLPMLEIVFDRLVRLLTTSLRNFTSDNLEVSLDNISTIRFEDYMNSVPLPAMLSVFKAEEWDNFGLMTVESSLIYCIVDVLLGGRGNTAVRVEGRPYTSIETNLIKRMIDLILADTEVAFEPICEVHFSLDRLETNPRFAAITRPANAAILVKLRIDMEDRGGRIEVLIPFATLEPIRDLLLQGFMGEKFGRDNIWENHLATQIWSTQIAIDAVLDDIGVPLKKIMDLKEGETITLDCGPDDLVTLKCGDISLIQGSMGRMGGNIAIKLDHGLKSPAPETSSEDDQDAQTAGVSL